MSGGALSNIDPESSRGSEVPQKFREKRGNATGNNGRRGKKLFSVFFPGRFFSFKIHGTQGGKVPEKRRRIVNCFGQPSVGLTNDVRGSILRNRRYFLR